MTLLYAALAILSAGAVLSFLTHRWWRICHAIGVVSALGASVAGVVGSIGLLTARAHVTYFMHAFPVLGAWSLGADAFAAVFLLATFFVSGVAALFATGYVTERTGGRLGAWLWPCFNIMVAAIATALLANSVLLFLLAWEALTIASWLLVISEYEKLESRKAAWLYFLASHAGTAFLIGFFALNHRSDALLSVATPAPAWLVVLPLLGFGIKAGIVPLHVWLPEAHPAAPSHVSAVMSGAMVSVGIYGLLRVLLSVPATTTLGTVLILAGALTAVVGAIQAVSSRRVKRLLAYSTVENSGIMLLGMGAAVLANATGQRETAFIALTAVLAHVLAHAAFKSTLFLGAGMMQHAAGSGEIDEISGLSSSIPATASAMFIASATAVAAPPFGAFVSEFLLYLAGIRLLIAAPAESAWLAIVLVVALALSGACALAAFVKLYGVPFLGRARGAAHAHHEWLGARVAYVILMLTCVLPGLLPRVLVWPAQHALAGTFTGIADTLTGPLAALARVNLFIGGALLTTALLLWLARRRRVRRAQTWNCGYTPPIPAAQYTGTSLVQPVSMVFQPQGAQRTDPFMNRIYRPASVLIGEAAARVRRIQHGQLHWYLLYVFAALVGALLIEFWGGR